MSPRAKTAPSPTPGENHCLKEEENHERSSESGTRVLWQNKEEEKEAMVDCPKSCASETILAWASPPPSSIYCNKSVIQKTLGFYTLLCFSFITSQFLTENTFRKIPTLSQTKKKRNFILFYFCNSARQLPEAETDGNLEKSQNWVSWDVAPNTPGPLHTQSF